ncbi:phosphopantothenate/pantothenate synthetase [Methanocella sp. CWC-04]|uniref:4-phosphopantoate--beta-alanine ligase n=1 Tax=Methanooceanicella nereidis TaxID=2052831 RepID=A0AAP2RC17_9EURY|nr:4-phosphopantoate--beta-alanine ligase [Methanocella sp. CWC-04]MCD1294754.1 phosphopantothenate/pantothenate synthetase [Methanocella sp. CWC-04]
MTEIPEDHPRYMSLVTREMLVKGVNDGITSMQGLIAQGRGEAFDYLIGEKTTGTAMRATKAAAAMLLLAERPVISVNGNTAALVSKEICELSKLIDAPVEVNLFHRTEERVGKIVKRLRSDGCITIYGDNPDRLIPGLSHDRAKASSEGIWAADVVLVPLEDGDRCEALIRMGKKVITIDLNPLSRTSRMATITIVDNIVRAIPNIHAFALEMKSMSPMELQEIVVEFSNAESLSRSLEDIAENLKKLQ